MMVQYVNATLGANADLIVAFDTVFDLAAKGGERTSFPTSHFDTPTHWKQTSLYLKTPIAVKAGDVFEGTVGFSRGLEYKRAYDIALSFVPPSAAEGPAVTQLWHMA